MRLGEQAKVLKDEIRRLVNLQRRNRKIIVDNVLWFYFRLERNQEREEGLSNLEYLKNIILKVAYTFCNAFNLFFIYFHFLTRFLYADVVLE